MAPGGCTMEYRLGNETLVLQVSLRNGQVWTRLDDLQTGQVLVDDAYLYRIQVRAPHGARIWEGLQGTTVQVESCALIVSGQLGPLRLEQRWALDPGRPILEERLCFANASADEVQLAGWGLGMQLAITDDAGRALPALASHQLTALPFRHRPTDPADWDHSFSLANLLRQPGAEHRATATLGYGHVPSLQRFAEGWAWEQETPEGEKRTLAVFKFNQEGMEFSVIAVEPYADRVCLRFGGSATISDDPSYAAWLAPGQVVALGVTRYEWLAGGYYPAARVFRHFLDAQGCRFPPHFDPPVHWNELYDNPEWHVHSPGQPSAPRHARRVTYTKAQMQREAAKAVAYGADALYMDPGWDTEFGTFFWGEEWLGPRRQFVEEMRGQYGLGVSLHCPLATWMSMDGRGVSSWPREALRMDAQGRVIEGSICLGAQQYLDAAAERLLGHCADGVVYLMFDGNWWNGGCWNPAHGHPVPYTREDHCRASLSLARRIHERFPRVLIEMHDMITGGTYQRYTPVYYKHGLPGSYDENWGFELMWQPMEDILSGRARALYYYNLGCNVPIYLHIDLRDDNMHCLTLWWYASTCRHLGIGGTHRDPLVADAQRRAMERYKRLKPFYTRGEFYGAETCPEEAHFHVLPDRNALVLNLFNLQGQDRVLSGSIAVEELGIDPDQWYIVPDPHLSVRGGQLTWSRRLPAYGTDVLELWPLSSLEHESG